MATRRWLGLQKKTAQVQTISVTAYDAATTYRVGIPSTTTGKTYSQIGTGGTTQTTAAALLAVLQASLEGEFLEITFTVNSNVITATANTPGKPFTLAVAVSGGTGTISTTVTTANQSPNDWNDALNFSTNTLPGNGDTVYFDQGSVDVLWNLDALSAVTTIVFVRTTGYTGKIGLPEVNVDNDDANYFEYRATELAFAGGTFTIEMTADMDPASMKLVTGSAQTTLTIIGTTGANASSGSTGSLGSEQVWWRGTHASNAMSVSNASVAIASNDEKTAVLTTLDCLNSVVRGGIGVTITTLTNQDSVVQLTGGTTTTLKHFGPAAVSSTEVKFGAAVTNAPDIRDGTLIWSSTSTLAGPTLGTDATVNFANDARAKTVTGTVTMRKGATWNDPYGVVSSFTFTSDASLEEITINTPPGKTFAVS